VILDGLIRIDMRQFWKVSKEFPFSPGRIGVCAMYIQMGEIKIRLDGQFVVGLYVRRIDTQAGKVSHLLQIEVGIIAVNCKVDDVGAGG